MGMDIMYMHRALILCLLARVALLCHFNISIIQHNIAERSNGVVELTCIVHGVHPSDIDFYWWLIDKTNSPLFTYSEKHDIDEIAVPYTGIVQNETHAFKDDMSSSTLVLNTNFTGKKIIRCEYNMADYTTCKYTKHIKFAGPRIQFKSFGEPVPHVNENDTRFFIAVSCHFNQAARNPRIAITIDGHSGELVAEQSVIQQSADYFHGHHFAIMLLTSDVSIICSVTDDVGTHRLSHLVTSNENKICDRSQDRQVAVAVVVAVVGTAICITASLGLICLILIRCQQQETPRNGPVVNESIQVDDMERENKGSSKKMFASV